MLLALSLIVAVVVNLFHLAIVWSIKDVEEALIYTKHIL